MGRGQCSVSVETQRTTDDALADQVVTEGELLDDCAALQLLHNLRIAGVVVGIDEIVRDGTAGLDNRLASPS